MPGKYSFLAIMLLVALVGSFFHTPLAAGQAASPITLAFVTGLKDDPFYSMVQSGIAQAMADLNVQIDLVVKSPEHFDAETQIPIIEDLIAKGNVNYLLVAPADAQKLIPVLQKAHDAGTAVITVDTFVGDGDYATGTITFPLTHISSDNFASGFMACKLLADSLQEGASIYIQHTGSGISTVDQRENGCQAAAYAYGLQVVGVDYNSDSAEIAEQQTTTALEHFPDLAGIFGTNLVGAQGAGQALQKAGLTGRVKLVTFDATENAVAMLKAGIITHVIAQRPFDMGYLAAVLAVAYAQGYESLPRRISVDSFLINADNVNDPAVARFIYSSTVQAPQPPLHDLTIGFVPGVHPDPFFTTMTDGVHTAVQMYGVQLVEQAPNHFSPPAQIPVIEALLAAHHVDYLITAPTDRDQLIPILRQVYDSGIQVITVDTFIGNGDYVSGSVTFPLSYIGSDNVRGGYIGCSLLAMADILGSGAKIYIQNVRRGISTTDQRADGCLLAAKDFGLDVVQMDYSDNDVAAGKAQTIAVLAEHPDIVGIFGTNVFSAQGAGSAVQEVGLGGVVEVVAFDSTEFAIDLLRKGIVTQVIAQKPGDIGYFAVLTAVAHARGITGIPKRWATGYEVINIDNVDDPKIARFIYREE